MEDQQTKDGAEKKPVSKLKEGAQAEEFILGNANGNGINPNPLESGNTPEWDHGTAQNEQYKKDATSEDEE